MTYGATGGYAGPNSSTESGFVSTGQINFLSDWLQMGRIHTAMHAAEMIDYKVWGNLSNQQAIGQAVRHVKTITVVKTAIVFVVNGPHPQPAAGHRLRRNETHKALKQWNASIDSRHLISFQIGSLRAAHLVERCCGPFLFYPEISSLQAIN